MMKKSDNLNVISMIIKSEFLEYDLPSWFLNQLGL